MARVYSSHTASMSRWSHSARTWGSLSTSNRQVPSQCTEPSRTSNGYPCQQVGHVVHAVLVVVDLEAQHDRQPGVLHGLHHLDVVVEVDPGVVVPVGGHAGAELVPGQVVPEAAQPVLGLGEPEEVLGDGDLGDALGDGPLAVGGHLVDGGLGVALAVRPEVEVVVEHGGPFDGGGGRGLSRPGG